MNILCRLKCLSCKWVWTTLGPTPLPDYESAKNGPILQLLNLIVSSRLENIELIRLPKREIFAVVNLNDNKVASQLDQIICETRVNPDYGYVFAGIPVDDLLVRPLVIWSLELYGNRVVLAPRADVIFAIKPAA